MEFQYVNFGDEDGEFRVPGAQQQPGLFMQNSARGTVLSALLFVPERAEWVDLYGKIGAARLDESFFAHGYDPTCGPIWCRFDIDQTDSRGYVGMGARFKIGRQGAIRVEYEAVDRDIGDPAVMLSVGIAVER